MAMAPNEVEVKIPENMSPFVVIVNGVEYSYPAGTTQMVPEEVAEVIRQHVDAMPEPAPNSGGGAGTLVVHLTQIAPMAAAPEPQWVADKTYEQIVAAVNSGCNVIAIYPFSQDGVHVVDYVMYISLVSAEEIGFNAFVFDPVGDLGYVGIYADGRVEVYMP